MKTLIITNDFPPRDGGIQTFVFEMAQRFNPQDVIVMTSHYDGDTEFDSTLPYLVIRTKTTVLVPNKRARTLAEKIIAEHGVTSVVFGAAAPLALLAPALRKVGVTRMVAITHGHEAGWAITPVTRQLIRRIGNSVNHMTYLGDYTRSKIAPVLSPDAQSRMVQLTPGVDPEIFHPRNRELAESMRNQLGIGQRPVVVCVSRLMKRKGQDALIAAFPKILESVGDAVLVIVGGGAYKDALVKQAKRSSAHSSIIFAGKVPFNELPAWYAVGDVFAMPCRTRNAGWDVEGLGIVFLEASATGLPVVAGDSGGAPDAVLDGQTGMVVSGRNSEEVSQTIVRLLQDPNLRTTMGAAGREWVMKQWTWSHSYDILSSLLTQDA